MTIQLLHAHSVMRSVRQIDSVDGRFLYLLSRSSLVGLLPAFFVSGECHESIVIQKRHLRATL